MDSKCYTLQTVPRRCHNIFANIPDKNNPTQPGDKPLEIEPLPGAEVEIPQDQPPSIPPPEYEPPEEPSVLPPERKPLEGDKSKKNGRRH